MTRDAYEINKHCGSLERTAGLNSCPKQLRGLATNLNRHTGQVATPTGQRACVEPSSLHHRGGVGGGGGHDGGGAGGCGGDGGARNFCRQRSN